MSVPFASLPTHVCVLMLQNWFPAQSPSTKHAPAATHLLLTLHTPERHTTDALLLSHGPSLFGYPHLKSAPHTDERHTTEALLLSQLLTPPFK